MQLIRNHGRGGGEGREETNLVDQELLSLGRVEHLGRVLRDQRIEERVEPLVVPPLRSQDSAESLSLLTSRSEVTGHLDQTGGLGQVDAGVSDLGEEDGADGRVVLEAIEDTDSLDL
jgi:hypothetical protein